MQSLKVLMADDEKDILQMTAKKVASEGYTVVTANDGQEAWDKIVSEVPDIVILDLNMPKLGGFEVLKKLRETPPSAKWQPVIIVSGQGELQDIEKGLSMEADHYITKPCSVQDILKAIRLMVGLIPQHKSASEIKEEEG